MGSIYLRGKTWWYQVKINGKWEKHSAETTDKTTAIQIMRAVETDLARQKHGLSTFHKNVYSFTGLWGEYIKSIVADPSALTRKKTASNHFLPFFKNKNIDEITKSDIRAYQTERKLELMTLEKNRGKRESEINFRSINYEIIIISHFFNFCMEKGFVENNPASETKKLNEIKRIKTLSDEDIKKLILGATNKLTMDIIAFLIYSGCRKGEALNLKWENVDIENEIIGIKGTKTKNDRYIPMSDVLKSLLRGIERNQDSLYVFNNKGAKIVDFKHSFKTACRKAGLTDLRIHDLRHVFASKMVMNGTSLYITGELLGHRTTQMTKRYSHLVPDTLKKAVDDVWGKKDK